MKKTSKIDRVRQHWRRRVESLERRLQSEIKAHAITRESRLVAVTSDPNVPKGSMFFIAAPK